MDRTYRKVDAFVVLGGQREPRQNELLQRAAVLDQAAQAALLRVSLGACATYACNARAMRTSLGKASATTARTVHETAGLLQVGNFLAVLLSCTRNACGEQRQRMA